MPEKKTQSLKGQLLLDSGQLSGSFFHRTVVLICQHDKDGDETPGQEALAVAVRAVLFRTCHATNVLRVPRDRKPLQSPQNGFKRHKQK